jgi:hypothetical protein
MCYIVNMSEYFTQCRLFNADLKNENAWRIDSDGFLRCTTSVLKSCVMNYAPHELGDQLPESLRDKKMIRLFVPEDEIVKAEALKTLEGKPIVVGHEWQKGGSIDAVGSVAGTPAFNNESKLLIADILVHDPAIIKRITDARAEGRLVDQSAAYLAEVKWTPGTTEDGESYDGVQRNLHYNHIALLPKGAGRAGEDVRILNRKEDVTVTEYTQVKIGNSRVRVMNEDVDKLESELEKKDAAIENAVPAAKLDAALSKVAELTELCNQATAERDTLTGQVDQLKQRIEEVSSPQALSNHVAEAVEEQNAASMILNSYPTDKLKDALDSVKKLFGHELRTHVINQVRIANKREALSADDLKNQDRIRGMFQALRDTATPTKTAVAGQTIIKAMNEGAYTAGQYDTTTARKELKYKRFAESLKAQEL